MNALENPLFMKRLNKMFDMIDPKSEYVLELIFADR